MWLDAWCKVRIAAPIPAVRVGRTLSTTAVGKALARRLRVNITGVWDAFGVRPC